MDNNYIPVEFDIIYLEVQDIITTSGGGYDPGGYDPENDPNGGF